ncbi:unnamed protein product [Calypogeia fissa]
MEEEDTVSYRVYPGIVGLDRNPPASSSVEERLEGLKSQSLSIVRPLAEGYIWQHEPFNLRACSSSSALVSSSRSAKGSKSGEYWESDSLLSEFEGADDFVPHLSGRVKFGDNLEDEWFVVYLLFEISRRIPSVSITVRDSDGEFLLIETAYFIPKWLKPDNSHNRVFIRQGAVHFVPLANDTPRTRKSYGTASLKKSLLVLEGDTDTRAPDEVQKVILERIEGYPEKAQKNVHRVRCKVPLSVAHILANEPQLISLAVESFYMRDSDSMKVASAMKKFSPKSKDGAVELVDVLVRMSRAMYAQLVQQVFQAPRNYPMPSINTPGFKEAEIGMKITVGFEMMYWERSSSEDVDALARESSEDQADSEEQISKRSEVPQNDAAWKKYKASLEQNGYFRGLLEGSKEYRDLLQAAVAKYRSTDLFTRVSAAMNAPARRIDELLSTPYSLSNYSRVGLEQSDDDHWLYNGEEDLTAALLARQKEMDDYESKQGKRDIRRKATISEDMELDHAAEVVKNVQSFVNKISSFEGAEFPRNGDGDLADEEAVDIDMRKLLKELGSVFDAKEISNMMSEALDDEDTEGSSDADLDESVSGSENEMESAETETANSKDTPSSSRAPASKDKMTDEVGTFNDEYSDALEKELKGSSLAKSFARRGEALPTEKNKVAGAGDGEPEIMELETDDGDDNDLVDVDVNLVESLLRSYMFQQGMPGPASNLLGAMGVELPDNSDQRPGPSGKRKK